MSSEKKIRNMEQIRAANALSKASTIKAGAGEGDPNAVCKKVPTLIINNGLLATAAFAKEGKEGIQSVINAIEAHLQHEEIAIMPIGKSMMDWLSSEQTDSSTLRRVTAESLAYLNYLRRFVQKGKNHGQRN
jgi:CRISPR/Cas system CMR-associated protein Cmr5 small subunit